MEVKEALAKAELPEALHLLSTLPSAAIEPHVIALSARYHRLEEEQLQGTLNYEAYQIGLNRLSSDILKLLQLLEKTFQPESTIQEVKANLRQLYLQRLQDKLADRHPINIQCAYSLTGTDWDRAQIAYDDIVLEQKEVSTSLERIFDEHRGRLLVIGEPGAGKTSLLLQLADALLQRRENRVPVILNLATWNETYKNFEHWLLETLPRAGSVSKAYAKTLVLEDRLLPLFDGLDEVKAEHRQACLDTIAQYGQVAEHQYVICSRTREYAEIGEAPVYAQIELQPLKAEQIRAELENSAQPEAKFLLHAIEQDPLLAEVVRNPFYFNTTQLLLASMKSYTSLGIQASTVEELQEALVEKFVAQQLNTTVKTAFSAEKSRKWLGFMAKKMEERGLVVFELVDLNLKWLPTDRWYYFLGCCVFIFPPALYSLFQKDAGVFIGCFFLLFVWLFNVSDKFNAPKSLEWSFTKMKSKHKEILVGFIALMSWLIFKLKGINTDYWDFLLFAAGSTTEYSVRFLLILLVPTIATVFKNAVVVFTIAIFFLFFNAGLVLKRPFYKKVSPYSSFLASYFRELSYLFVLIFAVHFRFWAEERGMRFSWQELFIFIIPFPFYLYVRHLLLRVVLWYSNFLPLDFLTFLREMDARHIFESPGGSWRFRHKILQDYFIQEYERVERE